MKVTRNTPDQLIVERTPWLLSLLLVLGGLVFLGVGLSILLDGRAHRSAAEAWGLGGIFMFFALILFGLLIPFSRRTQVLFLRDPGTVTLRTRSLLGRREVVHRLDEVSRAVVQERRDSDGDRTYRVSLEIDDGQSAGTHPLTIVYDNVTDHEGLAHKTNAWLDSARARA